MRFQFYLQSGEDFRLPNKKAVPCLCRRGHPITDCTKKNKSPDKDSMPIYLQQRQKLAVLTEKEIPKGCNIPDRMQSAKVPPNFVFKPFNFLYKSAERCFLSRELQFEAS